MKSTQEACLYASKRPGKEQLIQPYHLGPEATSGLVAVLRDWRGASGATPVPRPPGAQHRPQPKPKAVPSHDELLRHYREVFAAWHKEWFGAELPNSERAVIFINGARTSDGYEWHYMMLFVLSDGGKLYLAVPRFVEGAPARQPAVYGVGIERKDVDGFIDYLVKWFKP